jgi:hypothetical protein
MRVTVFRGNWRKVKGTPSLSKAGLNFQRELRMKTKFIRTLLFAALMSFSTALMVSAAILALHGVTSEHFAERWIKSVLLAWPLVFISILTIAPLINRLLDKFFSGE